MTLSGIGWLGTRWFSGLGWLGARRFSGLFLRQQHDVRQLIMGIGSPFFILLSGKPCAEKSNLKLLLSNVFSVFFQGSIWFFER